MGRLWRERRWRKLLNLIDHLPRNSHYIDAVTSDEAWAKQILAHEPAETPARQRMADWSPEMERLTDLYDLVGEVMRLLIALKGGKPGRSKPLPRPRTALDRLRARKRDRQHRSVVTRMLPHAVEQTDRPSA